MRFGRERFIRPTSLRTSGLLSAALHAALIAGAVDFSRESAAAAKAELTREVIFYLPVDRTASQQPRTEHIQWLAYGVGGGPAETFVDAPDGQSLDGAPARSSRGEEAGREVEFSVATAGLEGDSVFSVVEVQEQARRYEWSAAPVYPPDLLKSGVEGSVSVRFVVDTTGWADVESFVALSTTHPRFEAAVREALPFMRFAPARIGDRKVRQLVEQQFAFRIPRTASSATTP